MNEQEIEKVLKIFLNKIKGRQIIWYLEGSINLFVQGVPVEPKDIDITTTLEGLKEFRKVFKKEITKDFVVKENRAQVLKCVIENNEIEIALYEEEDKNSFSTIQEMSWKNLSLPTQPLQQALKFYKRINRQDKIKLIEDFLISSNSSKQEK